MVLGTSSSARPTELISIRPLGRRLKLSPRSPSFRPVLSYKFEGDRGYILPSYSAWTELGNLYEDVLGSLGPFEEGGLTGVRLPSREVGTSRPLLQRRRVLLNALESFSTGQAS